MNKKFVKAISSLILLFSFLSLPVNAEWKSNNSWWSYDENGKLATDWKQIDGKWYYFNQKGYMYKNCTIQGYTLDESGAWIGNISSEKTQYAAKDSDFDFDSNTGTIIKYKGPNILNSELIIPEKINNVQVKVIGPSAFDHINKISSIILPNGLEEIMYSAFSSCSNLTKINLPDSLLSVGKAAFIGCLSLEEIYFPKNIKYIGAWVFDTCFNIKHIYVSSTAQLDPEALCTSVDNVIITKY